MTTQRLLRAPLILGFLSLLAGFPTEESSGGEFQARGIELVSLVRDQFLDSRKAESWAKTHEHYAEKAGNEREFVELTRAALNDLKASHTAYYTPGDRQYHDLLVVFQLKDKAKIPSIGIDVTADGFIRAVFAGGVAERVGLRRGDKLLKANGEAFEPIRSFQRQGRSRIQLLVQRKKDDDPFEVEVSPRATDIAEEWIRAQKQGARLIERRGKTIAYMPFFTAAGQVYQDVLREAVDESFAKADALILDFRNGWGGADPSFLNLFDKVPPLLEYTGRDGTRRRYDPRWRKPLYLLINGGTKSGKEVVAFGIKKHKLGTLVGERTGGAVLAGRPFVLEGGLLYLAVSDVLVDGDRLEGKGVDPDVEVVDSLEFADGADPQLEKALDLAGS